LYFSCVVNPAVAARSVKSGVGEGEGDKDGIRLLFKELNGGTMLASACIPVWSEEWKVPWPGMVVLLLPPPPSPPPNMPAGSSAGADGGGVWYEEDPTPRRATWCDASQAALPPSTTLRPSEDWI
jgi:hypothetical protein